MGWRAHRGGPSPPFNGPFLGWCEIHRPEPWRRLPWDPSETGLVLAFRSPCCLPTGVLRWLSSGGLLVVAPPPVSVTLPWIQYRHIYKPSLNPYAGGPSRLIDRSSISHLDDRCGRRQKRLVTKVDRVSRWELCQVPDDLGPLLPLLPLRG